ncbi:MAG: DUF116 domain-containing protein [Candidatus Latescibacteria bacterium]|nr:DUF116 domain-containing protein [Candidatus Latescibacterota bacterium]
MHEQARHSVGDRKLGDEWQDWQGGVEEQGFDERSGLFVGLAAVGMALGLAGIAALWYLILPRLTQLDPRLPMVVGRIFVGVLGLIVLYFGLIIGSAATGRNLLPPPLKSWTLMRFLVPVALSIGQRLGLSKDRVGSSIIRFNNALTQAASKPMEHRVLILLPRCLRKPILEQILQLGERSHCETATVGGGTAARKVIERVKPTGIVAIACERDLVSGIRDVAPRIPVIGIANKRPEGPCKNTEVAVDEVEAAVREFQGEDQESGGRD